MLKFFKLKKITDERQEIELLRITSVGFWILYFGLAVHTVVQILIGSFYFAYIIGEVILMLIGGGFVVAACARKGVWSNYFKPNTKTNFLFSLGSAVVVGMLQIALRARFDVPMFSGKFISILLLNVLGTFAVTMVLLTISAKATKKRQAKLESDFDGEI